MPKSAADLMESGTADLIAAGKEVAAGVMQSLTGEPASRPSSITLTQTLNVGGRTYYERPFDNNKSCAEEVCGCCCYTPNITTYYADASSMVQIGEKDGQKCCCCTAPPKPPKGELTIVISEGKIDKSIERKLSDLDKKKIKKMIQTSGIKDIINLISSYCPLNYYI